MRANPVNDFIAASGAAVAFAAASPAVTMAWTTTAYIPDDYTPKMTPSLKAFLYSCLWGGIVLFLIIGAVIVVANLDPIRNIEEEA